MKAPARLVFGLAAMAMAALVSAACDSSKSSNPLSPSVAGPIGGVTMTAPKPLDPANGAELKTGAPISLTFENASSTSSRPFWYEIQVALDGEFTSIVHTAPKVTPANGGRTSYTVSANLTSNRAYFWRARAMDGANTGPYSANSMFKLVDPVRIETPLPISPTGGQEIDGTAPTLVVHNTAVQGTTAPVAIRFEVAGDSGFTQLVAIWTAPRSDGDTTQFTGTGLAPGTQYFWRASASDGAVTSPYSDVQNFKTKSPAGPPSGGGGGGGGGGNDGGTGAAWESCGSTPGDAIVRCVHDAIGVRAGSESSAFEITKRVAWLLRGSGGGLLIKTGGENIISWQGYSFSISRICFPDGHIYKVISDAGGANGPSWQDNAFVSRSLYVPAINPNLP